MFPQLTADPDSKALDRPPAPGDLSLVHDLVRTSSYLDRLDHMRGWLTEQGLVDPSAEISKSELQRVIDLRLVLRKLLAANHDGDAIGEATIERLNGLAGSALLHARFAPTGEASLNPVGGQVDRVMGRLLAIVVESKRAGTWRRLKICRQSDCRWAFYDHSKNRSGAWCSMSDCGNRAKARSYRERRKRGNR